MPICAATPTTAPTSPPAAWPTPTPRRSASIFTQESKPYEVEIIVAEVGAGEAEDQIYRLTYDGSVTDVGGFAAMGGAAEPIEAGLKERWHSGMPLGEALGLAVALLAADPAGGEARTLEAGSSRSPSWTGPARAASSAGSPATCSPACSAPPTRPRPRRPTRPTPASATC
ncbi:hypothetical protein [Nostocoides sp.]